MRWAVVAIAVLLLATLLWVRYQWLPERAPRPEPEAPAAKRLPEFPLAARPGPVLRGLVLRPDFRPAAHAVVQVNIRNEGIMHAFAFADEEGLFAVPVSAGELSLVVEHPESNTPRNLFVVRREDVDPLVPLEFRLTSQEISGRAVDRDGRPIPYASVEILAPSPPSLWRMERGRELLPPLLLQADRDGRFSARIQRGPVDVVCRTPSQASRPLLPPWEGELGDVVLKPLPPAPLPSLTEARR